ncbi:MAG: alpha-galactosidase, partial [Sphingobacteriaceae bacterium]
IKNYNQLKSIIWQGDQYRLADPRKNSVASIMYVNEAKTGGVIFNYLVNNRYGEGSKLPIRLKGLDATKKYTIKEINLYPGTNSSLNASTVYSGDFLMTVGYNPDVNSGRTSVVLQIDEAK